MSDSIDEFSDIANASGCSDVGDLFALQDEVFLPDDWQPSAYDADDEWIIPAPQMPIRAAAGASSTIDGPAGSSSQMSVPTTYCSGYSYSTRSPSVSASSSSQMDIFYSQTVAANGALSI